MRQATVLLFGVVDVGACVRAHSHSIIESVRVRFTCTCMHASVLMYLHACACNHVFAYMRL